MCRARRWWGETTRHIIDFHQKSRVDCGQRGSPLSLQKLSTSSISESEECDLLNKDHPSLRLTRSAITRPANKTILPLHISTVILPRRLAKMK